VLLLCVVFAILPACKIGEDIQGPQLTNSPTPTPAPTPTPTPTPTPVPGAPVLLYPQNQAKVTDTSPVLDWAEVSDAAFYHIQLSTNPDFSGTLLADAADLTTSEYQTATLANNTTLYWRVRAQDSAQTWSAWSLGWGFSVVVPVPGNPQPAHNGTITDTTPLLQWTNLSEAAHYHVQISTSTDFSSALLEEATSLTTNQYQVTTTLANAAVCYWRARMQNADGVWGEYSPVWGFTVAVPAGIIINPNVPQALNVTLSGVKSSFGLNGSMTVTAQPSGSGYTYEWYIDATLLKTGTENSLVLSAKSLGLEGTYTLTVITRQGSLAGSASVGFTVFPIIKAVAGGSSHTMGLKEDGKLWAWGSNNYGQLGDGTYTERITPVQVQGLSNVISIAAGDSPSLALRSDGTLWAWGYNGYGQLGDGTYTNRSTPVQVQGLSNVISIAAEYCYSLALRSDGTLWAWGYNYYGQLGDGTYTNRTTPVQVQGLSNVISIAAGYYHSLALRSDGTLWAWGYNGSGQLGDGTYTSHTTPVLSLLSGM